MNIERMLFFDKTDGTLILDTGEWKNASRKKTVDQQIATYKELSERNRETFDVIELEFGQYAQDFAEGRLIGVDLETKKPIFEYPNPENTEEPIVTLVPLSEEIAALRQENADQDFALMLAEGEAITARQEVADLNFTLMINGVI